MEIDIETIVLIFLAILLPSTFLLLSFYIVENDRRQVKIDLLEWELHDFRQHAEVMAQRDYHIQYKLPDGNWRTDLNLCMLERDFAKGVFATIRTINGVGKTFRLIKGEYVRGSHKDDDIEVLEEHNGNLVS